MIKHFLTVTGLSLAMMDSHAQLSSSATGVDYTAYDTAGLTGLTTYTSPDASDTLGWHQIDSASDTIMATVASGVYLYIRREGNDVSVSGDRDEFGIDNISQSHSGTHHCHACRSQYYDFVHSSTAQKLRFYLARIPIYPVVQSFPDQTSQGHKCLLW